MYGYSYPRQLRRGIAAPLNSGDEVHAPDLVRMRLLHTFKAMRRRPIPTRTLAPEIESFELVEAIDAFVIDGPAFRVDAPVAVADPREGNLPDTGDKRVVIAGTRRVVEG